MVIASSNADGSLVISLRAPKNNQRLAADICSQFPTSGSPKGEAVVNALPAAQLTTFLSTVQAFYTDA